jgi:hypothetical protein
MRMNMKTSKQISNAPHQSAPTVKTPKLPSILEQIRQRAYDIYVALSSARGIVSKLWKAIRIEIPTGYQDEAGFHQGVEPAEKEAKSCRSGSLPSRRRAALFHPFHRCPLGWQTECALASQLNRLPSAYLMHRREK